MSAVVQLLLSFLFLVGAVVPAHAASDGVALADVDGRYGVAAPVQQGRLALFPIVDREAVARPSGDYATLAEAMEAGTLTIAELDSSGTVANLSVTNRGKRPVLLTAGDVIQGGKQDRVLVQDVLVDPTGQPKTLAVNCVERGRWEASQGRLSFSYGGKGEYGLKRAVELEKDQGRTWAAVSELNARKARHLEAAGNAEAAKALAPSSGTYAASLDNEVIRKERDALANGLIGALGERAMAVGLVVAIDGEIVGSEVYGHPNLFARSRDELVRSFALDAVGRQGDVKAAPTPQVAATFLGEALRAHAQRTVEDNAVREAFEAPAAKGTRLKVLGSDALIHMSAHH